MAIFINEGEVYMILNGLSRKIKAKFIQNYEVVGDKLCVTDGNGEVKSVVANTDEEKAKLDDKQNKLIKRYNKKYRSKIRKRGFVFAGLAYGLVLCSGLIPALLPATIATALFTLSGIAATVAAMMVSSEYGKKVVTMDAQDYYLDKENKEDLDNFAKSDMCKHFAMQKKSPYKHMAKKLIKSTNENKTLNPFDFYSNGLTKKQLEQAKGLCELSKECYRNTQEEEVLSGDVEMGPTYKYRG
jgi:hypothetical protein